MIRASVPASLDVSCITVNFRTLARLEKLLESIEIAPPIHTHEMIVIENNSPDRTRERLAERFPWVHYAWAENGGFGAGNNRGMELAHGRYYLLLNPDTRVTTGMIDRWIAWMDAHPEVAISGPALVYPDGSPQASAFRYHDLLTPFLRRTPLGRTAWGKKHLARFESFALKTHDDYVEVEWLLGAALCIRREAALALNGLDERYFLYFEDEDFCRRAREAGFLLAYLPFLTLEHAYGKLSQITSWLDLFRKRAIREHIKSACLYFWRFGIV